MMCSIMTTRPAVVVSSPIRRSASHQTVYNLASCRAASPVERSSRNAQPRGFAGAAHQLWRSKDLLKPSALNGRASKVVVASSAVDGDEPPSYMRPERLAMAAAWASFFGVAAFVAPTGDAVNTFDIEFVKTLISEPFSGAVNPLLEAQFNSLGVMPAVYISLLFPGSKDQKPLPTLPFVVASFALGFGALGPYLVAREQREEPIKKSELGWYTRTIAESKVNAVFVLAFAVYLLFYGATNFTPELLADYIDIWKTKSALCCVSSFDLLILSTVIANPMREDCLRRGWEEDRAVPFCLLPVIGPALYLLLRPSLEE